MEVKKYGTGRKRLIWCKLYLAVGINTHEIIATELSALNVTDDKMLLNLFKQICRKINKISADGVYDTRQYY
ncbi:Mobile element protein [Candidatus Enterovibrio altilux]|uniref:Mobile element protein n=1 Tax=Candidatus Enterovibrio altilux TaxID=1927128 RepID=A0A291BBK9_9GAMM|nr:Mobile element protein [Candidatus Enterovibrio luxaltus]